MASLFQVVLFKEAGASISQVGEPDVKSEKDDKPASVFVGTIYTVGAFLAWGILPGYWKQLASVPPLEVVAHRIIWSCLFALIFVAATGKIGIIREILCKRKLRLSIALSAATIALNWFIFIYAVSSDNIVQASLGYYINPLVMIFLGMVVLGERLSMMQGAALIFACIGVFYLAFDYGEFPWIAVSLAFSFGFYGLIKKMANLDSITSLAMETLFLAPVSLIFLASKGFAGTGAFASGLLVRDIFIIGSGAISAIPLYWFAQGTKAIPLSQVGFIQYLTPTLMLFIGVFIYGEAFASAHMVSFGFIFTALFIYTTSELIKWKRRNPV